MANRKRVQRLYREDGLAVRWKGKRKRSQAPNEDPEATKNVLETIRYTVEILTELYDK